MAPSSLTEVHDSVASYEALLRDLRGSALLAERVRAEDVPLVVELRAAL